MNTLNQLARRGAPLFAAGWLLFVLLTALQPCCDTVAEASPHRHDTVAEINPEPHGLQQADESGHTPGHTHCGMVSEWQQAGFFAVTADTRQLDSPDFILIAVLEPQVPLLYTKQKMAEPLPWPSEASPPIFLSTQRLRI